MTTLERISFDLDGSGAGTALSRPLSGRVVEVRAPDSGATWTAGGSADVTLTRLADGGTILGVSNVSAPFSYQPSPAFHTVAGVVAGTASVPGVPVDDHVRLVVAQGAPSTSGAVYVLVHD